MANGTDALVVALRALDLAQGDEVIVPAFTFIATGSSVALAGGVPVFADVEAATLNLDPASVEERITERTVGVIGVHLFGRPFDVEALGALCRRRGLWLLEDAAQAHGATSAAGRSGPSASWPASASTRPRTWAPSATRGRSPATTRRCSTGCAGSPTTAGRSTTSTASSAPTAGSTPSRRRCSACAYPCSTTATGGAARSPGATARRSTGAAGVDLPADAAGTGPVYHQFTLLSDRRDALREHLADAGIGSAVYYPIPLHNQPALAAFAPRVWRCRFPTSPGAGLPAHVPGADGRRGGGGGRGGRGFFGSCRAVRGARPDQGSAS